MKNTAYARRADGKIIKAEKDIDISQSFSCLGCNQEVYAVVKYRKQIPHFRHNVSGIDGCSESESYIHYVTKELFAEHYEQIKVFYLEIGIEKKCIHNSDCRKTVYEKINLNELYPHIKVEKNVEDFRPDCLLYNNSGEKLFFEVCYTSKVTEKKIDSGIPIIELKVSNENTIDTILLDGGVGTRGKSFLSGGKYHLVSIYNGEPLEEGMTRTFDCDKKCIFPTPTHRHNRDNQRKTNTSIRNNSFEFEFLEGSECVLYTDDKAINYLARYVKASRGYKIKSEIPKVLEKTRDYAKKQLVKNRIPLVDRASFVILDNENSYMFVYYNGIFYGSLRYESLWHIFTLDDGSDILTFFLSVEKESDIRGAIISSLDIF